MKTTDRILAHFGGHENTIAALQINPETWRLWCANGVPPKRWLFVEKITAGAITAESIVAEARQAA